MNKKISDLLLHFAHQSMESFYKNANSIKIQNKIKRFRKLNFMVINNSDRFKEINKTLCTNGYFPYPKEKKMEKPKLLFKYRPVTTLKELVRLNEIVQKNELYLPMITQLNDPFEGKINVTFGVMGSSFIKLTDMDFKPVIERKRRTRLLSLSEDCFSPQLWAYYCNDYHGVCLCFRPDKTFRSIDSVSYPERIVEGKLVVEPTKEKIYQMIRESLLRKQEGWRYEKEWRMIFQPELDKNGDETNEVQSKLTFDSDELLAVIIGNKLSDDEQKVIKSIIPESVKVFVVHTGALSGLVKIHEYGYKYSYDGNDPDYISTLDELYDRLL